ncbi:hypothetical protein [Jatrophihabitans sp.]|jgi:hypothetical protein|uniref:hypothetical protein n=1 Tax=Jatrophihabitans sp. TaxID=1932789 RepID=UPI002EFF684D
MNAEFGAGGGPPQWPGSDLPEATAPAPPPPAWPVRHQHPVPFPAHAPAPPAAPGRHRRRTGRWLLAALMSAVLAAALGLAAAHRHADRSSAESVARGFFRALADGDAPAALAFADAPPRAQFLTSEVLRQQLQVAPLADISVLRGTRSGATATVEVRYRLLFGSGARSVADTATLVRRGSTWRMSRVAGTVEVSAGSPVAGRVRLAGRKLPAAAVTLFPGALPLAADPPALQVLARTPAGGADDRPIIRLADTDLVLKAQLSLSPELRQQAERAAQTLLAGCLAPAGKDPLCPVPGSGRPVPGSLHGSAPAIATVDHLIELEQAASGVISVRARVPVRGSWQVWDFENQVVQRRGPVTVVLDARVFLDRPTRAFWNPPR